ncbi:hypothetical protein [Shumkonia mesophila]|uniref:hypothetical protein n=1 Tax=Shumkonia mesophila TaxID=2838854 RepID=UPI00293487A7|nr:hypothetical protein [Shumkonia mesophila]
MLSQDIRNRAATLRRALETGHLTLAMLVTALDDFDLDADRVEAMEDLALPLPAQLNDANTPANVVRLARKLDRAGVTLGLPAGGGS